MMMNFSLPQNFETMRKLRKHDASSFLIALTALGNGLDVTYFRSQAEAGKKLPLFAAEVTAPIFFSVGDGRRTHFFNASLPDTTSASTATVTRNKVATKELLHRKSIPTAIGGLVSAENPRLLYDLARAGVKRFVMKPVEGSLGKGTFLNQTPEQAAEVLRLNPRVKYVIEQHIFGREHRLYVVDDRVVAAYWYMPPNVLGDGSATVRTLHARHQAERAENPFVVDRKPAPAEIDLALLMQKVGWDDVPEKGRRIWLATTPFPDAQGDFFVCTTTLPDSIRQVGLATAKAVAARNCAIDLIVNARGEAFVLEVNARPMIGVHSFPHASGQTEGQGFNLDVPTAILRSLFALKPDLAREVVTFDYAALSAEVFREGRSTRGVRAADFAVFGG